MAYGDTGVVSTGGHGWSVGQLRRGMQSTPIPFNPNITSYSTPTSMIACGHGPLVGSPGVRPKCALAANIARGNISLDEVNRILETDFQNAQDAHDRMTVAHVIKWVTAPPGGQEQLRKPNRWSQAWATGR